MTAELTFKTVILFVNFKMLLKHIAVNFMILPEIFT